MTNVQKVASMHSIGLGITQRLKNFTPFSLFQELKVSLNAVNT